MTCRHCQKRKVTRPRGLCWPCYYTPGVKDLHPSTSKFARRGVGNFCGRAAPCEPTDARPGTVEKLVVLELRARLGQELFHPLDAVVGGNGHAVPWAVPMVRWWRRGSKEEIEATDLGSDYTP